MSSAKNYPSSRILILDIHGEYQAAFADRAHVYKVNVDASKADQERLCLPFWAMEFDELMSLTFGSFPVDSKARNLIMERIIAAKVATVESDDDSDIDPEAVNADSPIPFDIKKLWYDLYCQEFGTYFSGKGKTPVEENWAYKLDAHGQPIKGDASKGLPPRFREVKSVAGDDEKINYLPETLNIRAQLEAFGAKLRIPRYNFFLRPGGWDPDPEGKTEETLACLMKGWIGSDRPVTILDLSGVPSAITNDVIGILLRLIYDCLFWARHLSQGGRERPLLLVLEEAHTYLNGDIGGRASTVVQRIVKEGRKYGIGAMIVSQRPSEINSTILSQCGTFFALRLSNGNDRSKITGAISENLEGLTSMLPILRTGEAIILGEGVGIPMRTMIEPPPKDKRPDSADPVVCDETSPDDSMIPGGWGIPMEADPNYEEVVALWRQQTPFTSALVNLDETQG
nr:ATP-binding protein [Novosphingobium sp. 9]